VSLIPFCFGFWGRGEELVVVVGRSGGEELGEEETD
jgi:hypothetical protein